MDVNCQCETYLPQKWGRYVLLFDLRPLELWCDVFSFRPRHPSWCMGNITVGLSSCTIQRFRSLASKLRCQNKKASLEVTRLRDVSAHPVRSLLLKTSSLSMWHSMSCSPEGISGPNGSAQPSLEELSCLPLGQGLLFQPSPGLSVPAPAMP